MAAKVKASAKWKEEDVPSAELIVASRFQQMRAEQRAIVGKIAEVEADMKEHRCVSLPLQTLFFKYVCALCVCVCVRVCVCVQCVCVCSVCVCVCV